MRRILVLMVMTGLLTGSWAAARAQTESVTLRPSVVDPAIALPRDLNLPQIGDPADSALTPAEEARLGAQVVAQLYAYEYLLEDPQLTEYLTAMGWRLAAASGTNPEHLELFVVKDPRINAFALPGGYMGFNAGLLTASDSESELAGVMAHELAHVTQRHIARGAAQGGGLSTLATWAAVLAAVIAGSADPDVILAALAAGQSIAYQRQVNFTRANELEADRIGIQTLAEAGFDPKGMSGFFQTLEQQSRLYGSGIPEFLRTHPVNTTRIAEAQARASTWPQREVQDSLEYDLMRARTQVFAARQPSDAVDGFAARIEKGNDTAGTRYGLAFALHQLGQNQRALDTLEPVLERHPRQGHIGLLKAAILSGLRQTDAALATYLRTLELYPRWAPAALEYAEALIRAGEPELARKVLLSHEQAFGTRLDTYRLLSLAARESGNNAEASYQMATYLFLRGNPGGALSQLDAGLRIAGLTPQDRARLAARRAEVREALPRNWDPDRPARRR